MGAAVVAAFGSLGAVLGALLRSFRTVFISYARLAINNSTYTLKYTCLQIRHFHHRIILSLTIIRLCFHAISTIHCKKYISFDFRVFHFLLQCLKNKNDQLVCCSKTGTFPSKKKKGQVSVLNKRTNACARHENDSKLKTMRLRITENSAGGGGGRVSFYIFSKVCYLHKDYVKLSEELAPKPTAHSQQSFFLSVSSNNQLKSEQKWEHRAFSKRKKKNICLTVHALMSPSSHCYFTQGISCFDITFFHQFFFFFIYLE